MLIVVCHNDAAIPMHINVIICHMSIILTLRVFSCRPRQPIGIGSHHCTMRIPRAAYNGNIIRAWVGPNASEEKYI